MRSIVFGTSLTATLAFAAVVHAAPRPVLVYSASDGCPSESAFVDSVASRGGVLETNAALTTGRIFDVRMQARDDGFDGSLIVRSGAEASTAREVHGESCAEVAQALAVVTAIAIVSSEPASEPASVASETHAPPPPPSHDRLVGASRLGAPSDSIVLPAGGQVDVTHSIALTAYGGFAYGVVPHTTIPSVDLALTNALWFLGPDTQHLIAIFRGRASYLGPYTHQVGDTSTQLFGASAGIGGCLSPHYDTRGLQLLTCFDVAAGLMVLDTKLTGGSYHRNVPLADLSLSLELRYNLSALFSVGMLFAGDLPLARWTAQRPDGTEIFRSGAVSGRAQVGLGINF